MLSYLYELLMSIVTYILGFFGVEFGKKSVTFADDVKKDDTPDISQEESKPIESSE